MDWRERKARGITRPDPTPEERERFMREALTEAQLAMHDGEVPIGAVIVLLVWLNMSAVVLIMGAELNGTLISLRKDGKDADRGR